jgi:hypothetical protein
MSRPLLILPPGSVAPVPTVNVVLPGDTTHTFATLNQDFARFSTEKVVVAAPSISTAGEDLRGRYSVFGYG